MNHVQRLGEFSFHLVRKRSKTFTQ